MHITIANAREWDRMMPERLQPKPRDEDFPLVVKLDPGYHPVWEPIVPPSETDYRELAELIYGTRDVSDNTINALRLFSFGLVAANVVPVWGAMSDLVLYPTRHPKYDPDHGEYWSQYQLTKINNWILKAKK